MDEELPQDSSEMGQKITCRICERYEIFLGLDPEDLYRFLDAHNHDGRFQAVISDVQIAGVQS